MTNEEIIDRLRTLTQWVAERIGPDSGEDWTVLWIKLTRLVFAIEDSVKASDDTDRLRRELAGNRMVIISARELMELRLQAEKSVIH